MNKDNIPYIKYLMILNKVYEFIVENPHDSKFQDLISTINLYLSKKEKLLRLQKQIQKQFKQCTHATNNNFSNAYAYIYIHTSYTCITDYIN